jgi:hypothetical protein
MLDRFHMAAVTTSVTWGFIGEFETGYVNSPCTSSHSQSRLRTSDTADLFAAAVSI